MLNWKNDNPNQFKIELLNILKKDSLLNYRNEDHSIYLENKFANYLTASNIIISQIQILVNEDPNFVRRIVKNFFTNNMRTFVTLYDIGRDEKSEPEGYFDKMKILSKMYEVLHIYKLAAFLFSRRNDPYDGFSNENKEKILKYLKNVGITTVDSKNLRLIRNSINHLPELEENKIIFESGDEMTNEQIDALYEKMKSLFSWWVSLLGTLCYHMPKFGIIVVFTGIKSVQNNKSPYKFTNTMSTFFPEYKEEQSKRKLKKASRKLKRKKLSYKIRSWAQSVKWKLLTKYYNLLGKNKFIFDKFYRDNFDEIANHLIRHSKEISEELKRLEVASKDDESRNQYRITAEWFAKGKPVIENMLYRYRIEGLSFFIRKINKAKEK